MPITSRHDHGAGAGSWILLLHYCIIAYISDCWAKGRWVYCLTNQGWLYDYMWILSSSHNPISVRARFPFDIFFYFFSHTMVLSLPGGESTFPYRISGNIIIQYMKYDHLQYVHCLKVSHVLLMWDSLLLLEPVLKKQHTSLDRYHLCVIPLGYFFRKLLFADNNTPFSLDFEQMKFTRKRVCHIHSPLPVASQYGWILQQKKVCFSANFLRQILARKLAQEVGTKTHYF